MRPLASFCTRLTLSAVGMKRVTSPMTFLICGLASMVAPRFFSPPNPAPPDFWGGFIMLGGALKPPVTVLINTANVSKQQLQNSYCWRRKQISSYSNEWMKLSPEHIGIDSRWCSCSTGASSTCCSWRSRSTTGSWCSVRDAWRRYSGRRHARGRPRRAHQPGRAHS